MGGRGHRLVRSVDDPRGWSEQTLRSSLGAPVETEIDCGRHSVLLSVVCDMSDLCCGSVLEGTMSIE